MANYLPPAPLFNEGDDWEIYGDRLKQFFLAYDIKDEKRKAALLLTAISSDIFRTFNNACFHAKPEEKTFTELCDIFKKQFSPVVSVYAERCKFYDAKQQDSETVTEWITRLRALSKFCEFKTHLEHSGSSI